MPTTLAPLGTYWQVIDAGFYSGKALAKYYGLITLSIISK
jgi:hypothetical protein